MRNMQQNNRNRPNQRGTGYQANRSGSHLSGDSDSSHSAKDSSSTFSEDFSRNLSPEKQQMIQQLEQMLSGKSPNEALPLLMTWQRQMQAKNIHFTPEENQMITDILYKRLTPAQRKQFELLKSMMKRTSPS